jgi:hypothetical protein
MPHFASVIAKCGNILSNTGQIAGISGRFIQRCAATLRRFRQAEMPFAPDFSATCYGNSNEKHFAQIAPTDLALSQII